MLDINQLSCAPETYGVEILHKVKDITDEYCEMHEVEKRFLSGLIRLYKPKNILEVGVSQGGGSALILNAIADDPGARLTSIDISETYYADPAKKTGWAVERAYPQGNDQWTLIAGKDPVEVVEELDAPFDFCIIDTAHVHPVESINFLTVFPFLTEGAVVVLHDIGLFSLEFPNYLNSMATKILFDAVVADKCVPKEKYSVFPNIGAFQADQGTKAHIGDVFSALSIPWRAELPRLERFVAFMKKHYGEELAEHFQTAAEVNVRRLPYVRVLDEQAKPKAGRLNQSLFKRVFSSGKLVISGAGYYCGKLLEYIDALRLPLPKEIWDINANAIGVKNGIAVKMPDFDGLKEAGTACGIVIAILSADITEQIVEEFKKRGFANYVSLSEALPYLLEQFELGEARYRVHNSSFPSI